MYLVKRRRVDLNL